MATVIKKQGLSDEQLAREMELTSPDGRPGGPVLHKRGLYGLLWGASLLCVLGGALVWAFTGDVTMAIAVFAVAFLGGILSSPVVMSVISRARERGEADREEKSRSQGEVTESRR